MTILTRIMVISSLFLALVCFGMDTNQIINGSIEPGMVKPANGAPVKQEILAQPTPEPLIQAVPVIQIDTEKTPEQKEALEQEEAKDPYKIIRDKRSLMQQSSAQRKKLDDQFADFDEQLKKGTKKASDILDYISEHDEDPLLKDFVLRLLLLSSNLSQDEKVDIAKLTLEKALFKADDRRVFQYIYEMLVALYDRSQNEELFDKAASLLAGTAVLQAEIGFPFTFVAETLLQTSKANINHIVNESDGTTLLMAIAKRCDDISKSLEKIQLMIALGANLNDKDKSDKTALDWAQENGCKPLADLLKSFGALPAQEIDKSKEEDQPLDMQQSDIVIMPEQEEEVD